MIIPLDFMTDYYGYTSDDKKTKAIPFYCSLHNRHLIEAYTSFTYQMDQVIAETMFNSNPEKNTNKTSNDKKDPLETNYVKIIDPKFKNKGACCLFTKDIKTEEDTKEYDCEFNNFCNNEVQVNSEKDSNLNNYHNDNSLDDNFQNIMALQMNFDKNIIDPTVEDNSSIISGQIEKLGETTQKESNSNFFNQINKILPQKPKYQQDDSITFNFNLPNLIPNSEYNFINIENNNNFNFNFDKEFDSLFLEKMKLENSPCILNLSNFDKVSKMFYDYFEQDISMIKEEDKSKITITQIKQLKKFLFKIIKNYKNCDKDISIIFDILKKEGLLD
jgi:hypothetical protein